MAVLDEVQTLGEFRVIYWLDPNRHRATINEKRNPASDDYSIRRRVMWSKNKERLKRRVWEWCQNNTKL